MHAYKYITTTTNMVESITQPSEPFSTPMTTWACQHHAQYGNARLHTDQVFQEGHRHYPDQRDEQLRQRYEKHSTGEPKNKEHIF